MKQLVNVNGRYPLIWDALNDFDRFFDGVLGRRVDQDSGAVATTPAIDVSETDGEYRIKAEVPGVKKEDLDISVQDGVLTIKAETKFEDEETKDDRVIRQERRYGKFVRTLRLGKDVDTSNVRAQYTDGVLELKLAKLEEVKPKRIEVDVH